MRDDPRRNPEQFERDYAARSRTTVEELRKYRTVRRCECGEKECEGFAMIPLSGVDEWDKPYPDGLACSGGRIPGSVIEGRP